VRADAALAAVVTLRPLREDEYREWDTAHRRGYEHGLVDYAGMERDAARAKVERDVAAVLPEGLATPGTWIWAVEADGRPVGAVFLGLRGADAWLYDVTIHAPDRGRGYGRAAMLPLEEELRVLGHDCVALNVWGGNEVAPAGSAGHSDPSRSRSTCARGSSPRRSSQPNS
jgi:ribosomal protein S18 acetylase RimI-like enzyme